MNFVAIAIPFFLLLVGLELLVNWWRKTNYYSTNDAINSLHLGVLSQLTGLAKKAVQFSVYAWIFPYISLFELNSQSVWVWIAGFVVYDFCYYLYHRCSHEINGLWASHVVHHQSEEYNLTTALRQTSGGIVNFVFYIPLAILGFEPIIFIAVGSLNLVYQFWVHTRHIDKMPAWFEFIFVTPSNHRVHHGQNPVYLDKNHGGVFILWDRLLGTYQKELDEEPVIYGVTVPLASWNPIWANFEVYWGLFQDSVRTKKWSDKFRVWYKKTGWRPDDVSEKYPGPKFDPYKQVKFDVANSLTTKTYILYQHIVTLCLSLVILYQAPKVDNSFNIVSMIVIGFGLFTLGKLQQNTKWSHLLETLKIALWGSFIVLSPYQFEWPLEISMLYGLSSLIWLAGSYRSKSNNINIKQIIPGN